MGVMIPVVKRVLSEGLRRRRLLASCESISQVRDGYCCEEDRVGVTCPCPCDLANTEQFPKLSTKQVAVF